MSLLNKYARVIARHPWVIIAGCFCTSVVAMVVAFTTLDLPDFSDPTLGFNTSDTEISDRLSVFRLLQRSIGRGKLLHQFSNEISRSENILVKVRRIKEKPKLKDCEHFDMVVKNNGAYLKDIQNYRRCCNRKNVQYAFCDSIKSSPQIGQPFEVFKNFEPSFCDFDPGHGLAVLAIEAKRSLLSWASFQGLCALEEALWINRSPIRILSPESSCVYKMDDKRVGDKSIVCCQPWHLASSLASHFNASQCSDVNRTVFELWLKQDFGRYFKNRHKIVRCWNKWFDRNLFETLERPKNDSQFQDCNPNLEPPEFKHFSIYSIFGLLLPGEFSFQTSDSSNLYNGLNLSLDSLSTEFIDKFPKLTLMILPIYKDDIAYTNPFSTSNNRIRFFGDIQRILEEKSQNELKIVGYDFGMKNEIFVDYLLNDTIFGLLALAAVFVYIWVYTGSFLFTLSTVIVILMALGLAYFSYRMFIFDFFPFVNLLTVILGVGLGADDAFIYRSAWLKAKSSKKTVLLEKLVEETLKQAVGVMFLTSFTTVVAFLCNFLSHIFVLKCFGIFAALAVTYNLIFSVTFLPSCVVLLDFRIGNQTTDDSLNDADTNGLFDKMFQHFLIIRIKVISLWTMFFRHFLPRIIVKLWYFWLTVFFACAMLSIFAISYRPGLKLSTNDYDHFQFFRSFHPMHRWERELRTKFAMYDNLAKSFYTESPLPVTVVWGIEPKLNSNQLEFWPFDGLNLSSKANYEFLEYFCYEFRRFSTDLNRSRNFLISNPSIPKPILLLPYCFVPDFLSWLRAPCIEPDGSNRRPCCVEEFRTNFSDQNFKKCLKIAVNRFRNDFSDPNYGFSGPYFRTGPLMDESGDFRVIISTFWTNLRISSNYNQMKETYSLIEAWISSQLSQAPGFYKNGWFVSELFEFYDLQHCLLYGTLWAILLASTIAFLTVLIVTRHLLVSLACVFTIFAIILDTIALMTHFDWQLNVLESTIVILAVGLSFDYTLHFASAFLSAIKDNETSVDQSRHLLCGHHDARFISFSYSYNWHSWLFHSPLSPSDRLVFKTLSNSGETVFAAALTTILAGFCVLPSTTIAFDRVGWFMIISGSFSWLNANFLLCPLLSLLGPVDSKLKNVYRRLLGHCGMKSTKTSIVAERSNRFSRCESVQMFSRTSAATKPKKFRRSVDYIDTIMNNSLNQDRRKSLPIVIVVQPNKR